MSGPGRTNFVFTLLFAMCVQDSRDHLTFASKSGSKPRLPCPIAEPGVRSRTSTSCAGMELRVVNLTPGPIDILWVGIDGVEVRSFALDGHGVSTSQAVCVGQVWRARARRRGGASGASGMGSGRGSNDRLGGRLLAERQLRVAADISSPWEVRECFGLEWQTPFRFDAFFGAGAFGLQYGEPGSVQLAAKAGLDITFNVDLTLEQMFRDQVVPFSWSRRTLCPVCHGRGGLPEHMQPCPRCGGTGVYSHSHSQHDDHDHNHKNNISSLLPNLLFRTTKKSTCALCGGRGEVPRSADHTCPHCRGARTVEVVANHTLQIPAGTQPGYKIRLPRQGHVDVDAGTVLEQDRRAGDAIFTVGLKKVTEYEQFEIIGHDIHTSVNISVLQALNGFNHSLPYLHGLVVNFTRTGITSPGTPIVVPGMGLPKPPRRQHQEEEGIKNNAHKEQQTPEGPTTTHHNISQYANANAGDLVITIRVPMPSELRRKVYSMTLGSDDGWAEAEEQMEPRAEGVLRTDTGAAAQHADVPPGTACVADNGLCADGMHPQGGDQGTHEIEKPQAVATETEIERDGEVINLDEDDEDDNAPAN